MLDKSGCKPNQIWADKDNKFCNSSMISWLEDGIQCRMTEDLLLLKDLLEP